MYGDTSLDKYKRTATTTTTTTKQQHHFHSWFGLKTGLGHHPKNDPLCACKRAHLKTHLKNHAKFVNERAKGTFSFGVLRQMHKLQQDAHTALEGFGFGIARISLGDVAYCANSVPLLPDFCELSVPEVAVCRVYLESP